MKNMVYMLSINFNYDSETNTIIETRCIKRETKNNIESKKQYLKGSLKEYSADLSPEIYNDLQQTRMLILETELTSEQIRLAMTKTFDLFTDLESIISRDASEEIVSKIQLSPAI